MITPSMTFNCLQFWDTPQEMDCSSVESTWTTLLGILEVMQETWVLSLGQGVPLEEGMATHSSLLVWKIPWIEKPGGLQPIGSQRVGHD